MGKSVRNQSRDDLGIESPLVSLMTLGPMFGKRSDATQTESDRARAQGALAEIIHARKAGGKAAQSAKIHEILSRG